MQKSLNKFLPDKFKTKHNFYQHQLTKQNEGLFITNLQKQSILNHLKKGSLFRISHHLKKQQNIIPEDPYLGWLLQNSQGKIYRQKSQHTNPKKDLQISQKNIQKQKKQKKNKLPKIQKFTSTYNSSFITQSRNKSCQKPLQKQKKIECIRENLLKKRQKQFSSYSRLLRTSNHFEKQNDKNFHSNHKNYCYENDLGKSQLFKKESNVINDQDLKKNIKNNFYLNDHKKLNSTSTFLTKKTQQDVDFDLKRIKGLSKFSVENFENNLSKLDKKANVSCYNQLSQHFLSMKKQIQALILEGQSKKLQKKDKIQTNILNSSKQNDWNSRIKTQDDQAFNSYTQDKESYLPIFLRKSLISPTKLNSSNLLDSKNLQNLRM